jgi:hypothetical protein
MKVWRSRLPGRRSARIGSRRAWYADGADTVCAATARAEFVRAGPWQDGLPGLTAKAAGMGSARHG